MFYVSCFMFCVDVMTRNSDSSSIGSNNVTIITKNKTLEKLAGDVNRKKEQIGDKSKSVRRK